MPSFFQRRCLHVLRGGGAGQSGQAMIEYVFATLILMAGVAIMGVFLYVFREQACRVLDLVASDYP